MQIFSRMLTPPPPPHPLPLFFVFNVPQHAQVTRFQLHYVITFMILLYADKSKLESLYIYMCVCVCTCMCVFSGSVSMCAWVVVRKNASPSCSHEICNKASLWGGVHRHALLIPTLVSWTVYLHLRKRQAFHMKSRQWLYMLCGCLTRVNQICCKTWSSIYFFDGRSKGVFFFFFFFCGL